MTKNKELALYFHIPFCVRKCLYCDFLSAPGSSRVRRQYMEALTLEALIRAEECRGYLVTSVFFGGGTPSVVDSAQIRILLDVVRENFCIAQDAELTIEVNPGTVDEEKLAEYRAAGINRLSIGLQSANDAELKALGRIHTWEQFLEAYRLARQAGFKNINVDVMSALPGQSIESYLTTLQKVIALDPAPEHISAYSLILEEGTHLYEMERRGEIRLPDEDLDRLMYRKTKQVLHKECYHRYEISNYAREGFACRHNCGYWRRRNYMGFGIGAASLFNNMRFNNGEDMEFYLKDPLGCREEAQCLSRKEQMEEFMFLGLRLTEGVSFVEFERCFGCDLDSIYGPVIAKSEREGLLKRYYRVMPSGVREEMLALTEFGLDVSNHVMAQFLL